MAVIPIVKYPDPVLTREATPVEKIDEDIRRLAEDMVDTMRMAPGAGLAAPQVGRSCRLIVVEMSDGQAIRDPLVLVNPKITSAEGQLVFEEACLSVVDYSAKVDRASEVMVEALDLEGVPVEIQAEGRLAVVLQHEIDHLDGILFIDRISRLKRDLYKRRLKKLLKKERESED